MKKNLPNFIFDFSKMKKSNLVLAFLMLFTLITQAQVTVTSTSGTASPSASYASLDLALTKINDGSSHTGTIVCNVVAGHAEMAPVTGFVITATGTAANPITFQKSGTGSNPKFTGNAFPTVGAINDAIFKIVGADYITIDGFDMIENGGTTTAATTNNMTEFGVAILYATTSDGSQNCTIKNCTIDLNRTYQNTFGIYSNSTHGSIAFSTSAPAIAGGSNSNLTITGNTITDVNQGIVVIGSTTAPEFNDGLTIGGTLANGNTITNFGTTGSFSGYANVSGSVNGILVRNTKNFNVSYNTITSSVGGVTLGALRAVNITAFSAQATGTFSNKIDYNVIDLKSGLIAGVVTGIDSAGLTSATATSSISVSNNKFVGLGHTTATATGALVFILQTAPYLNVTVSNNDFNSLTTNTTGTVTFINANYTMPTAGTQTYDSNKISGGFARTVAGGALVGYTTGGSSPAGTTHAFTNNNFSGISVVGATAVTGYVNADGGPPSPQKTISGNVFSNWSGGTSTLIGFNQNYGSDTTLTNNTFNNITGLGNVIGIVMGLNNAGTLQTVSNNTITNLTAGGNATGINIGALTTTVLNVTNNTINNLLTTGASGQAFGILSSAGAGATVNIFDNKINGLSLSGVTNPLGGGIAVVGSAGTIKVYKNKIYDIAATGLTTTSGVVNGIVIQGGLSVSCYNNIIGDLRNPLGSGINAINGIQVGTSTVLLSEFKVYDNSIYLNASSTGTNFGTSGIFHTTNAVATTGALDLRNNIIINESAAAGTGLTVGFRRTGAGLDNYIAASNRNLFSVGTPSATNVIYNDGTTSSTLATFLTTVTPREINSFSKEAAFTYATPGSFFISLTPSSADYLKPVAGITTQAESGGIVITTPAINDDYASAIRAGSVGYVGTGTSPDLGAFEFAGVTPSPIIVLTSITPSITPLCVSTSRVVVADITTVAGTITSASLLYSINGVPQTPIAMTNSGTSYTATIPVVTPENASVTWSISSTNSLPISSSYNGTGYKDALQLEYSIATSATNSLVCPNGSSTLNLVVTKPTIVLYANPTAVVNPADDEDLGNITISQGATVILNNTSARNTLVGSIGTATGVAGSYANYTAFGPYNLSSGQTYNLSLSSLQQTLPYNNAIAVYIDYNRNGLFTDAGEQAYTSSVLTSGAHTETATFTVPATAFGGLTRMRVICNEEALISNPNLLVSYGEFEDYSINIAGTNTAIGFPTVSWSDGTTVVGTGTTLVVSPIVATTYTPTITLGGCTIAASPSFVLALTVSTLAAAVPTATNVVCFGNATGTATTLGSGGTAPYSYLWSNGQTTATATGLAAGIYTCTITDAGSCSVTTTSVSVSQPVAALTATAPIATNVSCFGGSNGTATVVASGGTSPYSYLWSNGQTSATIAGLSAGTYNCTITDAGSCSVTTTSVTVSQPTAALTATAPTATNVSCFGGLNGTATAAGSGGTAPYSYLWSNGQATATITGLSAGTYNCTITDAGSCTVTTTSVSVSQPTSGLTSTVTATDLLCSNSDTGTATAVGSGGTLPYTFLWSNGQTNATATNLAAGSYTCTISDSGTCSVTTTSVSVMSPAALNSEVTLASTTLTATQSGATYQWFTCPTNTPINLATNQTYTPTASGSYGVIVTLAGCSVTSSCTTISLLASNNFDLTAFRFYPNPVNNILNIDYSKELSSIKVINMLGQSVKSINVNSTSAKIDMSELPSGSYFIEIKSFDNSKIIKVLKN